MAMDREEEESMHARKKEAPREGSNFGRSRHVTTAARDAGDRLFIYRRLTLPFSSAICFLARYFQSLTVPSLAHEDTAAAQTESSTIHASAKRGSALPTSEPVLRLSITVRVL